MSKFYEDLAKSAVGAGTEGSGRKVGGDDAGASGTSASDPIGASPPPIGSGTPTAFSSGFPLYKLAEIAADQVGKVGDLDDAIMAGKLFFERLEEVSSRSQSQSHVPRVAAGGEGPPWVPSAPGTDRHPAVTLRPHYPPPPPPPPSSPRIWATSYARGRHRTPATI